MNVYCDIDGVLADFSGGVLRAFGLPENLLQNIVDKNGGRIPWTWFPEVGLQLDQVNDICTSDFWAGLDWMPDGKEILELIEDEFGYDNIYLLTTPMPNVGSYDGKIRWVQNHIPRFLNRTIITQAPKYIFANDNAILIDDRDENIEAFRQHKGHASLVSRIWNKGYERANLDMTLYDLELNIKEI